MEVDAVDSRSQSNRNNCVGLAGEMIESWEVILRTIVAREYACHIIEQEHNKSAENISSGHMIFCAEYSE